MLDERWSEDADQIGEALRKLLEVESAPERVRRAEKSEDGRDRELEHALDKFGVGDVELDTDIAARIAYEVGRALATTPVIEAIPARTVLGLTNTAYGFEGPVPAALGRVAVLGDDGNVYIQERKGPARRTTAGDFLVDHHSPLDGSAAAGPEQADRMRRLAALVESARLVGAGQALLRYGAEYAREREQFGKAIGSYQGIAHRLADAAGALEAAELLVRKAAFTGLGRAGGDGAPSAIFAHMIWPKAVDAARLTATAVHQVFGGNGFAMEYDVQLYSRRIRSWTNRRARPTLDLREIARIVLNPRRRDAVKYVWHYDEGMPLPPLGPERQTNGSPDAPVSLFTPAQ